MKGNVACVCVRRLSGGWLACEAAVFCCVFLNVSEGQRATRDKMTTMDELEILMAERRMLEKKISERRILMERMWEEKRDEDDRIRAEEREIAEADVAGHERMLVAQQELDEELRYLEAVERSKLPPPPPLLLRDADRHSLKMEKMRVREAARGIVR